MKLSKFLWSLIGFTLISTNTFLVYAIDGEGENAPAEDQPEGDALPPEENAPVDNADPDAPAAAGADEPADAALDAPEGPLVNPFNGAAGAGGNPPAPAGGQAANPPNGAPNAVIPPAAAGGQAPAGARNPPNAAQGADRAPAGNARNQAQDSGHVRGADLIKSGCNFYEREDLGIEPFSKNKKEGETCDLVLSENADAFLYACNGVSDPPACPEDVKSDEGVVKLNTFFNQATVSDVSSKFSGAPKVFNVITGKAHRPFTATCECKMADKTETMKITSSFQPIGVLGILGCILLFFIN